MSLPPVGPQTWLLYTHNWDAAKDELLLQCLTEKIEECKPTPPQLAPHVLIYAMKSLNSQLNADLSLANVEDRVDFLQRRYVTFKQLMNLPETDWDELTNVVHADDAVWSRLFKDDPFYQAYYHRGEPEFYRMCLLFGANDVKAEVTHTVIVIEDSSPTAKKNRGTHMNPDGSSSEDEVNSPNVYRKLFHDDACSSVSPALPNYVKGSANVPWSKIKNKFVAPSRSKYPPKNAFSVKPKDDKNSEGGFGGSSCASWSPFK